MDSFMNRLEQLQQKSNKGQLLRRQQPKQLMTAMTTMLSCIDQLSKGIQKLVQNNSKFMENVQKRFLKQAEGDNLKKQVIKKFSDDQLILMEKTSELTQNRFHLIKQRIPGELNNNQKQQKRISLIKNWLGSVCKKVFSVGFSMLKSGQLQVNKVKAYCSQNILGNIMFFSQKHLLTQQEFQAINKCLKQELLPYFCLKYPQTEEKEVSKKFTDLLIERDIVGQNQYDYVQKSGVKFSHDGSGNYNSQIMEFLNYIISLPNQWAKKQGNNNNDDSSNNKNNNSNKNSNNNNKNNNNGNKNNNKNNNNSSDNNNNNNTIKNKNDDQIDNKNTFGQQFTIDMEKIFRKVQKKKEKQQMLKFKPKQAITKFKNMLKQQKDDKSQKIKIDNTIQKNDKNQQIESQQKSKQNNKNQQIEGQQKSKQNNKNQQIEGQQKSKQNNKNQQIEGQQKSKQNNKNQQIEGQQKSKQNNKNQQIEGQQKSKQNNKNQQIESQQNSKQIQEYREKVKSYTSFQIGRKISQNFALFSPYQIKSGNLKLTNSTIMRVVTKWCDELAKNFDQKQFLNRETPFKMKDDSQKYLNNSFVELLNRLLQRQYTIIKEQVKKVQSNNYFLQSQFSKQKIKEEFIKYTAEEGLVGSFCSSMFKVNENYLINYLNLLIHGINKALSDFEKIQRILKQDEGKSSWNQKIGQNYKEKSFLQNMQQNVYKHLNDLQNKSQALSETPQLIQFKVGDLLRCKCSSKEQEIIALYKEMERMSLNNPKQIKILRVKNKLDQGNKDILMNLLYKQKMIVEMQLAIKSEKSKFSQCANKFNHYFYEMKRAQFGPIMEMCSIWSSQDTRAEFYLDRSIKLSQNKQNKQKVQCCSNVSNKQQNRLPFRCGECSRFYYECSFVEKHKFCKQCQKHVCYMCQFQSKNHEEKAELIKSQFKFQQKINDFMLSQKGQDPNKIWEKQKLILQNGGKMVNIKSKQRKVLTFKTIFYEDKYYFFHQVQKTKNNETRKQLQVITEFKSNHVPQQFLMSNIIFTSENMEKLIPGITLSRTKDEFFVPKLLKQSHKAQKKSIALINKGISNNIFKIDDQIRLKVWDQVEKLNLSDNNLTSIQEIVDKFPKVELALLNNNKIEQISIDNNKIEQISIKQSEKWNNLKKIYLHDNNIREVKNISCLKNIQELNLYNNLLQTLPQSFKQLKSLTILDIGGNLLQTLPKQFGQLKSLTTLNIYNNRLQTLPQSFKQLKSLTTLNISNNQLQTLPQSFGQLKSLTTLNISNNKLQTLPKSFGQLKSQTTLNISYNQLQTLPFGQLKSLTTLNIRSNQLQTLPQSFGQLKLLTTLNIEQNLLQTLPQSFGQLKLLTQLIIGHNQLQTLPQSFGQLKSLTKLQIYDNQLQTLPQSFGQLKSLTTLDISYNKLQTLPQSFGQLKLLTTLNIGSNQLKSIPKSFGQLKSQTTLNISYNQLQTLPFGQLKSLTTLDITNNRLQTLPQSFGQLKLLTQLRISYNKLQTLPQSFKQLKSLTTLDITNNRLQTLPQSFGQLKLLTQLRISYNKLQTLPQSFKQLKSLLTLNITNNRLQTLPQSFGQLKLLTQLNIYNNQLQTLPQSFKQLKSLLTLNIYNNRLQTLPQSFKQLKSLTTLNIYNNQLQTLPQSFGQLKSLTTLNIGSNQLKSIPKQFRQIKSLNQLIMVGNPLNYTKQQLDFSQRLSVFKLEQSPPSSRS